MVKIILRRTHPQRLALNMFWCAFLLWPWGTLQRETISGFFGRRARDGGAIAPRIAAFIDWLHPNDTDHCAYIARIEAQARAVLDYD